MKLAQENRSTQRQRRFEISSGRIHAVGYNEDM